MPKVPQSKVDKLKGVLAKLVKNVGVPRMIEMPFADGAETSMGFCFLEMDNPGLANKTAEILNDYKLDKSHTFEALTLAQYDAYQKVPDEYVPPEAKTLAETENLIEWLMDEQARDQYAITHGET